MKPGRSHEIVASFWATCALINGGIALNNHIDANKADSVAGIYEAQGDYAQAGQYEVDAGNDRRDRNIHLGLTAVNLALMSINISSAQSARSRRRQE